MEALPTSEVFNFTATIGKVNGKTYLRIPRSTHGIMFVNRKTKQTRYYSACFDSDEDCIETAYKVYHDSDLCKEYDAFRVFRVLDTLSVIDGTRIKKPIFTFYQNGFIT